jgi:short-subunit dehydrogenase
VKHALTGLAEVLRTELDGTGVHVSLVCPGVVQTGIAQSERNRPAEYPGRSHADPELARRYREAVAASATSPDQVAAAVIEALVENRFLVLPSPEGLPMIEQRLKELQSAIGS